MIKIIKPIVKPSFASSVEVTFEDETYGFIQQQTNDLYTCVYTCPRTGTTHNLADLPLILASALIANLMFNLKVINNGSGYSTTASYIAFRTAEIFNG